MNSANVFLLLNTTQSPEANEFFSVLKYWSHSLFAHSTDGYTKKENYADNNNNDNGKNQNGRRAEYERKWWCGAVGYDHIVYLESFSIHLCNPWHAFSILEIPSVENGVWDSSIYWIDSNRTAWLCVMWNDFIYQIAARLAAPIHIRVSVALWILKQKNELKIGSFSIFKYSSSQCINTNIVILYKQTNQKFVIWTLS